MLINNINSNQGLQNAIRPGRSDTSRSNAELLAESEASNAQLPGITERVNRLEQEQNLNLVKYPPFFPIATYQQMDLVGESRDIRVDIEHSSLGPELKQTTSGLKLAALRDTLSQGLAVSKDTIQPGSKLKVEV
jgi:hypothetical protein